MTLYVVRHADARSRATWTGDDMDRPLTEKGRAQAERLIAALAPTDLRRVVSSAALRCRTTVEPLARCGGCVVEPADTLIEGRDPAPTVDLLEGLLRADGDSVVCAHGDQLPEVVCRLVARLGGAMPHDPVSKKGSTWVLRLDGDNRLRAPEYVPPS